MTTPAIRLPLPPSERAAGAERVARLDVLAPKLRDRVGLVVADVGRRTGHTPIVWETLRTPSRQAYLYGFGRQYDDGRGIVTNAPTAFTTWHGYGLATDLVHPTLRWSAPRPWWDAVGESAERHGLVWGGRFSFFDGPHVQFGAPMRRSPSGEAVALLESGGVAAVWRAVGAA